MCEGLETQFTVSCRNFRLIVGFPRLAVISASCTGFASVCTPRNEDENHTFLTRDRSTSKEKINLYQNPNYEEQPTSLPEESVYPTGLQWGRRGYPQTRKLRGRPRVSQQGMPRGQWSLAPPLFRCDHGPVNHGHSSSPAALLHRLEKH